MSGTVGPLHFPRDERDIGHVGSERVHRGAAADDLRAEREPDQPRVVRWLSGDQIAPKVSKLRKQWREKPKKVTSHIMQGTS